MNLRTFVTDRFHGVVCKPDEIPQAGWGCCGCGAPEMDAYVTVGCDYCKAPGEGYCWACIDEQGWLAHITLASFTVLPGRERTS